MNPVIHARGLTKSFGRSGRVVALDGLDLVAGTGRVTAVLGPNGSGKTTFVRAVATLTAPDGGELTVAGIDARRRPELVRSLIGLAGQSASVDPALSGRENLEMVARLFGHRRRAARRAAGQVLELLALGDAAKRLVRTYSGGMRRRLDLGVSLVGAPRLLLLDEPTTGLDPGSRNELWAVIRRMVDAGTDVLLTTQYLDEADQLAHDIVIIDQGRSIATGTPDELKAKMGGGVVEVRAHDPADLDQLAGALERIGTEPPRVDVPTRRVTVPVTDGSAALREAVRISDDLAIAVDDIGRRRSTLDEVFLALTGTSAADTGGSS